MSARLGSLLIWALATGSAVFWGLRIWAQPQPIPAHATVVQTSAPVKGDLTRLLGTDPVLPVVAAVATPVADSRLTLLGVVSPRGSSHQREALAVISVDGKPARTYRVGAVVDGSRVLQSVSLRGADLGPRDGPTLVSLSLPAQPEAARGFPGAAQTPPGLPMAPPVGLAEQNPEPVPGAAGQMPGQDRARVR
jgi:general secretion pathway protein C